jgi:hypothetical protein
MIDTDKYEGHTEGPWRSPGEAHHIWRIESETEIDEILEYNTWVAHICVIHNEDDDTINAELIADAPLILQALIDERAEVKRLRKELNYAKVTIDDWDKSGPCVTVYHEGCEYVGMLRLYKDENGKVIE